MSRSRRLKPVVRHVDDLEQQALKEVARHQSQLETEQQRLAQLRQYRSEYQARKNDASQVYSAFQLVEYQRFLQQLDQTIEQQQLILQQCEVSLNGKREQWKETRVNAKLMHKVVDNINQQETHRKEKLEQKEMDEHSLRKHSHPPHQQ